MLFLQGQLISYYYMFSKQTVELFRCYFCKDYQLPGKGPNWLELQIFFKIGTFAAF